MVVEAIHFGEAVNNFHTLHAYVIMPNHVHVVWLPLVPMSRIMHWQKAATACRANRIPGLSGAFWQEESYDHWVRSAKEWRSIIRHVEWNPVKAGLAQSIAEWPWSSGNWVGLEAGRQQDCLPYSFDVQSKAAHFYVPPYGMRTAGLSGIGSMEISGMCGVIG